MNKNQKIILSGVVLIICFIVIGIGVSTEKKGNTKKNTEKNINSEIQNTEKSNTNSEANTDTMQVETETTTTQNADITSILQIKDPSDPEIKNFVAKNKGKTIEFDGNIANIVTHGDYKTRYDILIGSGDYNETSSVGPQFKMEDVGLTDMGIKELYLPDYMKNGANIHIIAVLGDYDENNQIVKIKPTAITSR